MTNLKGGYAILNLDIQKYEIVPEEEKTISIIDYPEFKELYNYLNDKYANRKPILINIIDKVNGNVVGFFVSSRNALDLTTEDGPILVIIAVENTLVINYHVY